MNVSEMTDEGLVRAMRDAQRCVCDAKEGKWSKENDHEFCVAVNTRDAIEAELLSRLSRGALAERKLAVAVEALKKIDTADFEFLEVENITGVSDLYNITETALAEIEAMK